MECQFERSINMSTGNGFNATHHFRGHINASAITDFNANMGIYTNSYFSQIAPRPFTVSSSQPIYIGIREAHENKLFKFIVHQCFATPTSSMRSTYIYTFFLQKCPTDDSFVILNADNNQFNFVIEAFKFIQVSKSVYIHCLLHICKTNSTSDECTQRCSNRKRRDVSNDHQNELPVKEVSIKSEKISFQKKATCKDILCPSYSTCINIYPAICRCDQGYVFTPKANACSNKRTFNIYGLHLDMQFVESYLDPYSAEFLKLSIEAEEQLNNLVSRLDDKTIDGFKIIGARKGSVIVDLEVIYAKFSNKVAAYETLLKAIASNHTETLGYKDILKIKINILPTMESRQYTKQYKLIIAIIVPLLVVAMTLVAILKIKSRRQHERKNVEGVNNGGISMEDMN
jgi:hypothetical protein